MITRNLTSPLSRQTRPRTMTASVTVLGVLVAMVVVLAPRETEP